jgi:hypothetical protein
LIEEEPIQEEEAVEESAQEIPIEIEDAESDAEVII